MAHSVQFLDLVQFNSKFGFTSKIPAVFCLTPQGMIFHIDELTRIPSLNSNLVSSFAVTHSVQFDSYFGLSSCASIQYVVYGFVTWIWNWPLCSLNWQIGCIMQMMCWSRPRLQLMQRVERWDERWFKQHVPTGSRCYEGDRHDAPWKVWWWLVLFRFWWMYIKPLAGVTLFIFCC